MVQPTRIVSCAFATETHALATSNAAAIRFMIIPLRQPACRRCGYGTIREPRRQAAGGCAAVGRGTVGRAKHAPAKAGRSVPAILHTAAGTSRALLCRS